MTFGAVKKVLIYIQFNETYPRKKFRKDKTQFNHIRHASLPMIPEQNTSLTDYSKKHLNASVTCVCL